MTVVMFSAWILIKGIGGFREWFLAFLAACLNIAIFMAKPEVSTITMALILQALLLATGVLALIGMYRFLERAVVPYAPILMSMLATLASTWVLFDQSKNPLHHFALGSVMTGIYFLIMSWLVWTPPTSRYPARSLFAFATLLHGVFMCSRTFLFIEGGTDLMFNNFGWNGAQLILIEQLIMVPLFGFGLLMMANEKNANELRTLAEIDSLTNLYNRRAFLKSLEQSVSFARRTKSPLSVFVLDVDHFKKINDRYGHDVGDAVLKWVTTSIVSCLRTEDVIGRLGGEEFAISLRDTNLAEALVVAERIREQVSSTPLEIRGENISCSVSIGVTGLKNDESTDKLLRHADQAMYAAKTNGRNRVEHALD